LIDRAQGARPGWTAMDGRALMAGMDGDERIRGWFVPLSRRDVTLGAAARGLAAIGIAQDDVPFVVKLVENPRYDLPGFDFFHGATTLRAHDYIHIVLGRGLLPKDESFVIGFTMGSTDRVSTTEEHLYAIFSKYLYPKAYRSTDDDIRVFRDAAKLGFVSDCRSLATVDFDRYLDWPLGAVRGDLGIEEDLLRAYYAIEKRRFPHALESQRLLR
jgi:hypothetical protein